MTSRKVIAAAFGIAFANLATLGLLIGNDGASRAYAVGLHTLFRDHAGAVAVSGGLALALTALAARRLTSIGELALLLVFVLLADVVAGLGVVVAFGEITLVDMPRVLVTETAAGSQLLATVVGAFLGYLGRRIAARTDGGPDR